MVHCVRGRRRKMQGRQKSEQTEQKKRIGGRSTLE